MPEETKPDEPGDPTPVTDAARDELLDVYASCLAGAEAGVGDELRAVIPLTGSALLVAHTPGRDTALLGTSGRMTFVDRTLSVTDAAVHHDHRRHPSEGAAS